MTTITTPAAFLLVDDFPGSAGHRRTLEAYRTKLNTEYVLVLFVYARPLLLTCLLLFFFFSISWVLSRVVLDFFLPVGGHRDTHGKIGSSRPPCIGPSSRM